MKTLKRISFIVVLVFAINATAATYTVDNRPDHEADFDSLSAAITAALPGDALYVMGSQFSYGNITLPKTLTIYGPGYFLGENNIEASDLNSARLESLTITAGGSGSKINGIEISGTVSNDDVSVDGATDVAFRRCYFQRGMNVGLSSQVNGLSIVQCKIGMNQGTDGISFGTVSNDPGAINVIISNSSINFIRFSNTNSEVSIDQCVIGGGVFQNATVRNSIFTNQSQVTFDAGTTIEFSLNPGQLLPEGSGNINGANLDLVLSGWNSGNPPGLRTEDTWTQLVNTPLNPALGAGSTGQDLGMYAGDFPYVVSGLPPLPRISSAVAPAVVGAGDVVTVEIEVTSAP